MIFKILKNKSYRISLHPLSLSIWSANGASSFAQKSWTVWRKSFWSSVNANKSSFIPATKAFEEVEKLFLISLVKELCKSFLELQNIREEARRTAAILKMLTVNSQPLLHCTSAMPLPPFFNRSAEKFLEGGGRAEEERRKANIQRRVRNENSTEYLHKFIDCFLEIIPKIKFCLGQPTRIENSCI